MTDISYFRIYTDNILAAAQIAAKLERAAKKGKLAENGGIIDGIKWQWRAKVK